MKWSVLFLAALFLFGACSRVAREFPQYAVREFNVADQLKAARDAFHLASQTETRGAQMGLAKKGVFYARRCTELAPRKADCHFYEALNTGLYYQARVLGYPSGMVRIAAAAEKVIALDPHFEEGGGYRVLGKLYLEAPAFNLGTNQIQRDLEKSRHYLQQAIQVAPDYPENHLFLAETLLELEERESAKQHLGEARRQLPANQFSREDKKTWHELIEKLEKKLQ